MPRIASRVFLTAVNAGARLAPFRRMVVAGLTAEHGGVPRPLRLLRPRALP